MKQTRLPGWEGTEVGKHFFVNQKCPHLRQRIRSRAAIPEAIEIAPALAQILNAAVPSAAPFQGALRHKYAIAQGVDDPVAMQCTENRKALVIICLLYTSGSCRTH